MEDKRKITLISVNDLVINLGIRILSAYLKNHGHEVDLIFLTLPNAEYSEIYGKRIIDDLVQLCRQSDLIGLSILTNYFVRARELTIELKKSLNIPIIWGGVHPTVSPEECLCYADMVCVGEGEEAILELVNKLKSQDLNNIKNIWVKNNGKITRNELRSLEENLDKYPFQDYDISNHYVINGKRIVKMSKEMLMEGLLQNSKQGRSKVEYRIMTARNCPFSCAYCYNNFYRKLYDIKGNFVRKRSLDSMFRELESIKENLGFIEQVFIADDDFFIRDLKEIREFCNFYKEKIKLPMKCHVSPMTADEGKIREMLGAGLFAVSIGVQSFSERILLNLYKRPTPQKVILRCVDMFSKFKKIDTLYHLIIDNPYEKREDKIENIKFAVSLPKGARSCLFPLVFYPGTELYERARRDGLIRDKIRDIYLKSWAIDGVKRLDYLTCLLYLSVLENRFTKFVVRRFIKVLLSDGIVLLFDNNFFVVIISPFRKFLKTRAGSLLKVLIRKFYSWTR